jgi:cytochrome c oxidase cbb3-type subunit 3
MQMRAVVRGSWIVVASALALSACNREDRPLKSVVETGPRGVTVSELYPGPLPALTPPDPRGQQYEGNAQHIANGAQYYKWFNCVGCHFNGGGGIGPALMDDKWRYGGRIEQIYATIVQGRPNGMPAFRDKIPDTQVWEIAAYVRSMSGNADKLAAPSRGDEINTGSPISNRNKAPPTGDPAAAKAGGS